MEKHLLFCLFALSLHANQPGEDRFLTMATVFDEFIDSVQPEREETEEKIASDEDGSEEPNTALETESDEGEYAVEVIAADEDDFNDPSPVAASEPEADANEEIAAEEEPSDEPNTVLASEADPGESEEIASEASSAEEPNTALENESAEWEDGYSEEEIASDDEYYDEPHTAAEDNSDLWDYTEDEIATEQGSSLSDTSMEESEDVCEDDEAYQPYQKGTLRELVLVSDLEDVKTTLEFTDYGVVFENFDAPGNPAGLEMEIEPFFGSKINGELLVGIRNTIISYYQENGRPLITVNIPPQDITDGVLQIAVIESRVDQIEVKSGRYFPESQISKMLSVQPGDVVNSRVLLQDIEWINRSPYRNADLIFSPGKVENTTNLEIRVSDRFPMRFYAGVDNTGSLATGHTRWFGGFSWANVFNFDHTFSYQGTVSTDFKKFYSHTLNYVAPLSNHNVLMFYGGYSQVKPEISNFRSTGASTQVSGRYQIPFVGFNPGAMYEFTVGADFKVLNTNLVFLAPGEIPLVTSHIHYTQLMAGYSFGKSEGAHTMSLNAQIFGSPGTSLGNSSTTKFESLRFRAKNYYLYGRFMASYIYDAKKFSFYIMERAQMTTTPLLPPEQYGVGGYDTVRGYRERQVNADNMILFNVEFRSPKTNLFSVLWNNKSKKRKYYDELMVYGFFDYAYTGEVDAQVGEDQSQQLYSIGPGLKYIIDPFFSLRIDWGIRLRSTQFENAWGSRVSFGLLAGY